MSVPRFAAGNRFVQKWAEELGIDPDETRRVVIDATAGEVVRVYVEKFGSELLLDVRPPSGADIEVTVLEPRPSSSP